MRLKITAAKFIKMEKMRWDLNFSRQEFPSTMNSSTVVFEKQKMLKKDEFAKFGPQ